MSTPLFQTHSGARLNPLAIDPAAIDLHDIAHHLAHLCRFNGATRVFYSVAEHSVRVSKLAQRYALEAGETAAAAKVTGLWGLLHDASEAYIADVTSPVKETDAFAHYRAIEAELQRACYARFGLNGTPPAEVKRADDQMLAIEFRDLMNDPPARFVEQAGAASVLAWQLRSGQAKAAFVVRFEQLGGIHAV